MNQQPNVLFLFTDQQRADTIYAPGKPRRLVTPALDALAQAAHLENETKEDIGARRLHTLFEKMLEDISFNAGGDMPDVDVTINGDYVAEHLGTDAKKMDMRQYIL